jgi:hypothetical protein
MTNGLRRKMGFDFEAIKVIVMLKKMCCTSLEIVDGIKSFGGNLCLVKLGMIFALEKWVPRCLIQDSRGKEWINGA